jgi:MOSC domain-containing protein YiiM
MAKVLSVNVAGDSAARTGINKQPVDHPVAVRAPGPKGNGVLSGLAGDRIANGKVHGGNDQAVYAYAREDLDWWAASLGRSLTSGFFGENLTTIGVDVNGARIGERWQIGSDLVLETTFAREPCATFQNRMREPHWVKRFAAENRTGTYLRVVTPGLVQAGDPIVVVDRPAHGVTIAEAFHATYHDRTAARALLSRPGLTPELQAKLAKHAG